MPALHETTLARLREELPATATDCVEAIVTEVPGYHRAFDARLRSNIERAVEEALATFLDMQVEHPESEHFTATLEGARALGHGEAVTGRTTDALLTAYRVGARVAWQRFSSEAVAADENAEAVAELAARTFSFIDELSAASLAGHTEALTQRTRELARRRDQLASALASGENRIALSRLGENARWAVPTMLTALVVNGEPSAGLQAQVGDEALWTPVSSGPAVALVPDASPALRRSILRSASGQHAALGPNVPWTEASESVRRAHRLLRLFPAATEPLDCDRYLPELVLDADARSAARLAEAALAPLGDFSEAKRDVLASTLLSWLLHQGRRDEVAAALHVHPQTVRYRMSQLRELYGAALTEPRRVLELILGLVAADLNREGSR